MAESSSGSTDSSGSRENSVSIDSDETILEELPPHLTLGQAERAQLQRVLTVSRRVGIAVGVLMAAQQLTESEAFETLRNLSRASQLTLSEVADQIVTASQAETSAVPPKPV